MSADRIFCYTQHRLAVDSFLHEIGGPAALAPRAIADEHALEGLDHITFVVVDNHQHPLPQRMWEKIITRGALVIHIDDQYRHRLEVHHHAGEAR